MKNYVQMVTLWGSKAPSHSITAILITEDQRTIVTGSHEGPICLWDLSPDFKISSKQMLFGHGASVTCLAKARDFEKQPYVVSATENGEMSIWDVSGGECVANTRLPFRHTAICYYRSSFRMTGEGWLLCCGQYNDILIIDAKTLAVLHTLASSSSSSSDWISCMCLVHSLRIQEDSLLAVSVAGDLKVWDLSSSVSRIQDKRSIYERESQFLDWAPCNAIRFCTYTERLLLAVFSTCWKVYDYCDFCLLWTECSSDGQSFAGGEILAAQRLIIWTEDGHGHIYQLLNSGLSRSIPPSKGRVRKEALYPILLCSTDVEENKSFSYIMGFMNERKEPFYKILYSGEASGRITLWHVPDVPVSSLDGSPKVIPIAASRTLQDNFDVHCAMAEGIIDRLWGADGRSRRAATITASIYIPSLEKLVCGCQDGRILIMPALQAAKARLLGDTSVLTGAASPRVLSGHGGSSVTALLAFPGRPAPRWLLSGSRDSCVVWWDLFTEEALHRFALQAGPVADLLLSPSSCTLKGHRLVCCVCGDHSVALLHVQDRTCLLHARKHLFPVTALCWHPVENLLIVGCENGSVYAWDIETGSLERHESGEMARSILASWEDSDLTMADPPCSVLEEDTHKEKEEGGLSSSSGSFGHFSYSRVSPPGRSSQGLLIPVCHAGWPFALFPMKTSWESINVHVLLFDLEKLVELLGSSPVSGLKLSTSFHSFDAFKRVKSTMEKRTLMLKRNRTPGSLSPVDGQLRIASEEQHFGENNAVKSLKQNSGIKRHKRPKSSKKVRRQLSRKAHTDGATDAAKLLLSCFFPWGVDRELDDLCVQYLNILRLRCPVSFGLLSKDSYFTLMLPGWRIANPVRAEKQQEAANLFSSKVLHLYNKYYCLAQEQAGRKARCTSKTSSTEQVLTLTYLLSRMCLVQRIIKMPPGKASPLKPESLHNNWRPAASLGTADLNPDSPEYHPSFVKLISCWRDQSIEAMEATQAALLAEVQQGMQHRTVAGGCGQTGASGKVAENGWLEDDKTPSLLAASSAMECENCITPPNPEGEDATQQRPLEEPGNPDIKFCIHELNTIIAKHSQAEEPER